MKNSYAKNIKNFTVGIKDGLDDLTILVSNFYDDENKISIVKNPSYGNVLTLRTKSVDIEGNIPKAYLSLNNFKKLGCEIGGDTISTILNNGGTLI
jgi:hypothetical protein